MKFTNKYNLPEGFVKAVSRDYAVSADRLSATSLLKGIKEIVLTKRHWEELEADVSDQVWALFGTAVHSLLEEEGEHEVTEETLRHQFGEITVTGRLDNYNLKTKVITDYKTCSIWKIKFKDFSDWEKQGMIYSWLMRKAGFEVETFRVVAMIKDHSKSEVRRDSSYPESAVCITEYPVTEQAMQETEELITGKVDAYLKALQLTDDEIVECTPEERWAKPDKWAVKKEGRKTAIRVLDDQIEAENMAEDLGKGHYVEYRKGISTKCVDYCAVKDFCHFGKLQEG